MGFGIHCKKRVNPKRWICRMLFWVFLVLCVNPLFAQSKWDTYETSDYSIQYPSNWEFSTDGDFLGISITPEFTLLAPDENPFMMVQLFYYERDVESVDDIDLKIFRKNFEACMQSYFKKFAVIECEQRRNISGPYIKLMYSYEQIEQMKGISLFFVDDDNSGYYSLQFTTLKKDFEKCKKLGEDMLNTFYIEK